MTDRQDETPDSQRDLLPFDYGAKVSINTDKHDNLLTIQPKLARHSMYEFGCETENRNLLSPNPKITRYTRRRSIVKPKYPSVSFIPLIVCVSVIVIFTLLLILVVLFFGGCYFN